MGTPVEHNEGKPTYNSPCVTRKATPEELAEIDKQIKEKNPFGLEGSPSVSYTFPKKEKKKADKLTREEFNAQRKAKQAENIEKCRKLAEQGLTKHEISERTGIATKTIERYAQKNGFRYAHKADKRILEKREKALKDVMQSDGSVSLEKLMGKLEKEDVVNHPSDSYYEKSAMQPLEVSQVLLTKEQFAGALLFNVIKYQMRKNHKGQKELDEYKARQYAYWLYLVKQGKKIDPSKDIVPSDFDVKVV